MKLRFIVVGKDRGDPMLHAADDYLRRLTRYVSAELIEVKEASLDRGKPVERVQRVEAERIEKALSPEDYRVVLDERGRGLSSQGFAQRLDGWRHEAVRAVAFVIGGPSGLHPEVLARARERWSLSAMTLPHRMARLVLLEQAYRAFTILKNEPYHK